MSEAILLSLDPVQLSPEERARAVAAILAGGLLRLRKPISGLSLPLPVAPEILSKSLANPLADSANTSVTVSPG